MKSAAKWLIAGGAILLFFAFLLPIISVAPNSVRVSLLKIAGAKYLFLLYLYPLGALTTLILALAPAKLRTTRTLFMLGQFLGLGLSFLLLLGLLAYFVLWSFERKDPLGIGSILPAACQTSCEVWPGIGFFVLSVGFGLATFGLSVKYFSPSKDAPKERVGESLATEFISPPEQNIDFVPSAPRLEFQKGELANQVITLEGDDFSIGRGRENNLQLVDPDRQISRVHARLRYAENAWFIQDQGSKIGTFVNGKRIKAARLNSGDEITIGEHTFSFRN